MSRHRSVIGRPRASAGFPRALLLALALGASPPALACSVGTAGVAFGAYDPFSPVPLDGVGRIEVDCDASYSVLLGGGNGQVDQRQLAGPVQALLYNLFIDAARNVVWGDGSGGSAGVTAGPGQRSHIVYGRIPARQNIGAGAYTDNVIVTVSF